MYLYQSIHTPHLTPHLLTSTASGSRVCTCARWKWLITLCVWSTVMISGLLQSRCWMQQSRYGVCIHSFKNPVLIISMSVSIPLKSRLYFVWNTMFVSFLFLSHYSLVYSYSSYSCHIFITPLHLWYPGYLGTTGILCGYPQVLPITVWPQASSAYFGLLLGLNSLINGVCMGLDSVGLFWLVVWRLFDQLSFDTIILFCKE